MPRLFPTPQDLVRIMEEHVPFNRLLGISGGRAGKGWAELRIKPTENHIGDPRRPALHGGVLSSLIDAAGGLAAWSALSGGETVSTVDLTVDYLEPARPRGILLAKARLTRKGNTVCHVRVDVAQAGILVAEGRAVYSIHRGSGAGLKIPTRSAKP